MSKNIATLNINSFSTFINRWVIFLIYCWCIWPFFNFKTGFILFLLLFALWFLTTDFSWIFKDLPYDLLMFVLWIFSFVPYLITGNFYYGEMLPIPVLISFFLFFFGIFINHYYMYYKKDISFLGKISFAAILLYVIASIQSSIGLKEYPLAARALATGTDPLQGVYLSLGIGGFGFVYSAVFINIALLYFLLKKTPKVHSLFRYFCLMAFIVILIMIFSASYATSLLFMFLGTLFVFVIKGKKSLVFSVILSFFFFLIFPKELIGYFLIDVASLFETNNVLSAKFMDFAQGFLGDSVGSQTSARTQLYLASLKTFLQNPLFGIYGPFGNAINAEVGGHSGWLDLLAYYGLFGSIPLFIAIFLNFRKQLRYYANHPYYNILLTAQILFVFFGFINPVISIYQIGFVYFTVIPAIPFLANAFSSKELKEISNEGIMGY